MIGIARKGRNRIPLIGSLHTSFAGRVHRSNPADEILYFQSDSKYTRVVARGREGLIRKSLKELLEALDPLSFWQVHRATVVNLNAIERVTRDLHGHLVLRLRESKEALPVSESFAHLFRQM